MSEIRYALYDDIKEIKNLDPDFNDKKTKNPIIGAIKHHFKKLVHHRLAYFDNTPIGTIPKNHAKGDKIRRIHNQKFLTNNVTAIAPKTIDTNAKNMMIKIIFKKLSLILVMAATPVVGL